MTGTRLTRTKVQLNDRTTSVSHPGFSYISLSNLGGIEKRKMDLLASYNDENVEDSPSTVSEKQVNQFLIPSKYRFDQIVIKFHFSDPLNEIKIEPEKKTWRPKGKRIKKHSHSFMPNALS